MIVYTLHMFSGRIFINLDYKWQNCFQAELLLLGNIASKSPPPPPPQWFCGSFLPLQLFTHPRAEVGSSDAI